MTGRKVEEWVGATPDSPVPPRVKLRIWERADGRCHISGRKIMAGDAWDLDHVIALCNWTGDGHGNRETNLAPALRDKHREKTATDVAEKSRAYRKRVKNIGLPKRPGPLSKDYRRAAMERYDAQQAKREELT